MFHADKLVTDPELRTETVDLLAAAPRNFTACTKNPQGSP